MARLWRRFGGIRPAHPICLPNVSNAAKTSTSGARCPLCGSHCHRLVYDMRVPLRQNDVPGLVVRCTDCGMWFKVLEHSRRLDDAYGDEYDKWNGASQYFESDSARAHFRTVLHRAIPKRNGVKARLLDVGTGPGTMLEEAEALGFEAEGVDLCQPLVERARSRGLQVHHGRVEDVVDSGGFDVVTMMDVIEHVPNPLEVMQAVRRLLVPGGMFICYTPNHRAAIVLASRLLHAMGIRFAAREIFGCNHVAFFDNRTLPTMLSKAGFEVEHCDLSPYDPERPGTEVSRTTLAFVTAIEQLGKPLGRVFRMVAYARKPAAQGTA